jgi:hypothetical protein
MTVFGCVELLLLDSENNPFAGRAMLRADQIRFVVEFILMTEHITYHYAKVSLAPDIELRVGMPYAEFVERWVAPLKAKQSY